MKKAGTRNWRYLPSSVRKVQIYILVLSADDIDNVDDCLSSGFGVGTEDGTKKESQRVSNTWRGSFSTQEGNKLE